MSWKWVGKPTVHRATRALAQQFQEMPGCPRDREIRETRMNLLRKQIASGAFRTCEWASCVCNGVEYRVNGKHTSRILSEIDKIPDAIHVVVSKFEADTLEDVANLYSTFDTRSSARSTSDINKIYAGAIPELDDVPMRVISCCVTGIAYAKWGDTYTGHAADERASLLLENVEFVRFAHSMISTKDGDELLRRGPVVGAMMKTWLKSAAKAEIFWTDVRDATDPNPHSPSRMLNKILSRSKLGGVGSKKTGRTLITSRECFAKSIHAWNAWRRGVDSDLKYYAGAKVPEAA